MLCLRNFSLLAGRTRFSGGPLWLAALLTILFLGSHAAKAEELAEGARLVQLTTDGKSRAWVLSPRGEWLAYLLDISITQAQLRAMRVDGSEDRAISPVGNPFFVAWSWGGDRLSYQFTSNRAVGSQGNAFIYDFAEDRSYPVSQTYSFRAMGGFSGFGAQGRNRRPGVNDWFTFWGGPRWSVDDKFVAFKVNAFTGSDEVWISDSGSGKYERILTQRGGVGNPSWSGATPSRLAVNVSASGTNVDVASVSLDGTGLTMLTDIGAASVKNGRPAWSPTGEWVAYKSDLEMSEQEQQAGRSDMWIARPDGSEAINLTLGTSNSTEDQISMWKTDWSWDGQWILNRGDRYDEQGRPIPAAFLVSPQGGYEIIRTPDPAGTGEYEMIQQVEWSYDSTRIAMQILRNRVRNWTGNNEFEDSRSVISIYDIETRMLHDVLFYSEDFDHKMIDGRISWSPDGKSLWITVSKVVSSDERIMQPDVFRLDLPSELVGDRVAQFHGPPIGVGAKADVPAVAEAPDTSAPADADMPSPGAVVPRFSSTGDGEIIAIVEPRHLTVTEIQPLIPSEYTQYIKTDSSRNLFVFVGPETVHAAMLADLEVIDFPAEHIVVDFLAIETSDAITRELGLDWAYTEGRFSFFAPEGQGVSNFTPGFQVSPPVFNQASGNVPNADIADRFGVDNVGDLLVGGLGTFPGASQALFSGAGKLPREFFVRLSALHQDGEITVVANPRTVATSGKKSFIQIRRVVNFFFTEGVNLATGTPNVRKADVTATTEGTITPTLLSDGKVHMTVDVSVGTVTFGAEDLPQQTDRKATTEVTVAPGDTIIIGGLRQQEHKFIETKTPILGSIPYLGKLFTKTRRENQHSVLTILITPRIMGQEVLPTTLPDPGWTEYELDDRYKVPIIGNGSLDKKKKMGFFRRDKKEAATGESE